MSLTACSAITDAGVRLLELKLPLSHLNLDDTQITDASISTIVGSPSLKESLRDIAIRGTHVTDGGLQKLTGHGQLTGLFIGSNGITRQGIQIAVMGNSKLHVLQFSGESPDDALHGLANHTGLQQASISGRQLDASAVAVLNSLPSFRSVAVASPWSDRTFDLIAKLRNLSELHVGGHPGEDDTSALTCHRVAERHTISVDMELSAHRQSCTARANRVCLSRNGL